MEARRPSGQFNAPMSSGMMGPGSFPYMPHPHQYGQPRQDSRAFAGAPQHQHQHQHQQQQQQHHQPQPQYYYPAQNAQYQMANRPQAPQLQTNPQFARMDPYGYGMAQPAYSPVDMRFPQPQLPVGYGAPGGYADMSLSTPKPVGEALTDLLFQGFPRRESETAAIPSFPRGPPRKPKQSGHALWVGNLPPAATVTDLKDHFSRDATTDIQSLFLISKSNCAFVNYRTEAACVAAMNRFHDSRFHGVRLVCRLRRGSTSTSNASAAAETSRPSTATIPDGNAEIKAEDSSEDPVIVGGSSGNTPSLDAQTATPSQSTATKVPEKFFIVKSLTLQDLEASVRNGIWATQSHNEATLNQAYNEADNVYLIFSANKSGEYFGYARMGSSIKGESVPIGTTPTPREIPATSDGPKSIPTPATATAPRGRIIDDSARGTIFWEAELSDEEGSASPDKEVDEGSGGQDLGRPFKIEWISTARLPFYRTRGLRNPWNANREVKIARDGTELEPSIGKRLVQMFHRPAQMVGPPASMQPGGMPYVMP